MPKVTFNLKLTVDNKLVDFEYSEVLSKREMLSDERPQLLFKQFCERLVKRKHERQLEEDLKLVRVDDTISKMFTKDSLVQSD